MAELTQKLREVRHAKARENQVAYARAGLDVVEAILGAGLYVTNRRLEHGLKQTQIKSSESNRSQRGAERKVQLHQ